MPASYPSAIKTFTTLVDGVDDVLASHQNDPNAEITAIETELGTNPRGVYADVSARLTDHARFLTTKIKFARGTRTAALGSTASYQDFVTAAITLDRTSIVLVWVTVAYKKTGGGTYAGDFIIVRDATTISVTHVNGVDDFEDSIAGLNSGEASLAAGTYTYKGQFRHTASTYDVKSAELVVIAIPIS